MESEADFAEDSRRLRESKEGSEVKVARGCCGGCQCGFVRLRKEEAAGSETGFCACVEASPRRGSSCRRFHGL